MESTLWRNAALYTHLARAGKRAFDLPITWTKVVMELLRRDEDIQRGALGDPSSAASSGPEAYEMFQNTSELHQGGAQTTRQRTISAALTFLRSEGR